jgi:hypothetical protein
MPPRTVCPRLAAPALAAVLMLPMPAYSQAGPALALTPQDNEAQEMGLEMAVACNPRRQGEVVGSESTIRRASDALAGTAIFSRSAEGTFLSLEQYDEALEGHCLVFGWFGGDLVPGRYRVTRLSMRAMEEEQASGDRSFYSWGAVRASDENSMLLAESGTLEILSVEPGQITGSFELSGFLVDGNARGDGVAWSGSFSAVEGQG